MKKHMALREAEKEKLWEDLQREREERMAVAERLKIYFPSYLGFAERSSSSEAH